MRHQIQTWLDDRKPLERELVGFISDLKQQRSFAQTIRDGLRLIRDLRQGKVEVLEQLFPFVKAYYTTQTPVPAAAPDPDTQKRIALLEQALLQQNTLPSGLTMRPAQLPASNSNPMQSKQPLAPKEADDLIEVKRAKDDQKSGWNALISMCALQGSFASLPPDVLAYGRASGRIPPQLATEKRDKPNPKPKSVTNVTLQNETGSPKPLTGFKAIPAPNFDELAELAL